MAGIATLRDWEGRRTERERRARERRRLGVVRTRDRQLARKEHSGTPQNAQPRLWLPVLTA
eukprot:3871347-Rhodomonas_salina.1